MLAFSGVSEAIGGVAELRDEQTEQPFNYLTQIIHESVLKVSSAFSV